MTSRVYAWCSCILTRCFRIIWCNHLSICWFDVISCPHVTGVRRCYGLGCNAIMHQIIAWPIENHFGFTVLVPSLHSDGKYLQILGSGKSNSCWCLNSSYLAWKYSWLRHTMCQRKWHKLSNGRMKMTVASSHEVNTSDQYAVVMCSVLLVGSCLYQGETVGALGLPTSSVTAYR